MFGHSSSNSLICVDFCVDVALCFDRFKSVLFSLSCSFKVGFLCVECCTQILVVGFVNFNLDFCT